MNNEMLQRFCNTDSYHQFVQKPFSSGDYTYATDGHIMIRVPRRPGIEEADDAPKNLAAMFGEAESRVAPVWRPLPEYQLTWLECPSCKGSGHVKDCPRLNKEGCWRGAHHTCGLYDEDCGIPCGPKTKGAKHCKNCDGTGKIKEKNGPVIDGSVGKVKISAIYLDLISTLPEIMIAPYDSTSSFLIKFGGGDGLLMPMHL